MVAAQTASLLLNKKVNNEHLMVGDLVFVVDFLLSKQPNSLYECLAKVIEVRDKRNYIVQLLNKKKITRHLNSLVSTSANYYNSKFQYIDPFLILSPQDLIIPSQVNSEFDIHIEGFTRDLFDNKNNIDDDSLVVNDDENIVVDKVDNIAIAGNDTSDLPDLRQVDRDPDAHVLDEPLYVPDSDVIEPEDQEEDPGDAIRPLQRLQHVLDQQHQQRVFDSAGEASHPRILAYKSKKKEVKDKGGAKPKEVKAQRKKKGDKMDIVVPDNQPRARVRDTGDTEWCPKIPVKKGITSDRQLRSAKKIVTFSEDSPSSPHPLPVPNSDEHSSPPPFPSHPPTPDQSQTLEDSDKVNPAVVTKDSLAKLNTDLGSLTLKKKPAKVREVWVLPKASDKKLLSITHEQ